MSMNICVAAPTFETFKGEVKVGGGGTVHAQELTHLSSWLLFSSSLLHCCYDVVTVCCYFRSIKEVLVQVLSSSAFLAP